MVKNYSLTKISHNFKRDNTFISLLFLFVFLVVSINIQAQGQGQPSIGTPILNGTPVCGGSTVEVRFTVTDGNGNGNGNDNKRFKASTSYSVYIIPSDGTSVLNNTFSGYDENNLDPQLVTLSVPISNNSNSYPTSRDYKIRVESSNPYAVSELSDPFMINNTPTPKPTVSNNGPVCIGSTLNLFASTAVNWNLPAVTGPTYNWTGPNDFNSTLQNPSLTNASVAMAGTYTVTSTVNGCTSVVASTNVIVNAPTVSNNGPVCAGLTLNLFASTVAGATYNWTGPNGFASTLQNPSFTNASAAMTGTYTVTSTVNGCTSAGASTNIIVNAIPIITDTSPGSRCGTGTVVLGAVASSGTINWYAAASGGSSLGTGTTFTTPSISSNKTYYVDATSNACTTGSRTAVVATVNPIPTITGSTPGSRCGPGAVSLGATASAGTINWYATASGGSSLGTGTTFTTPSVSSSTTFYVDATVIASSCTTATRTAVIATIKPIPSAPVAGSNSPVCAGGSINLTASFITGATYSWTGPNGFNSTLQNPSLTNASAAMGGTYTVTSTMNGCTSVDASTNIIINASFIWTGNTNSDWNTASNWTCNSIPNLNLDAIIPGGLTNYPILNSGAIGMAKAIQINSGATLTIIDNTLQIAGSVLNSGIFNSLNGSVAFVGAAVQSIPSNVFFNNRISNLIINNPAGVSSSGNLEITGFLRVESGNFNTGNALTLISNPTQTALIEGSGNGQVVGLVRMQRYLDKAFGYKYFSSPFQNSVVGDFAPYMDFSDPISDFPNFYRYNENRNININDTLRYATGWVVHSGNLNIAEGYALNFGPSTAAQTIELIGEVNNGTIPVRQLLNHHREYTKGFHLVGNPYPSPIDWNANNGWTRTNIDDAIHFFSASDNDQYTGSYTSFVNNVSTGNNTTNSSPNIIPSMQGFFIKVSDSDAEDLVTGTFGMDNKVRINDFNQEFFRASEVYLKQLIRLEANFKTENKNDALVIYFSPYATQNFEKEMDAHKLMNTDPSVPSFYNITENQKTLAINAIPYPESKSYRKIPLGIKTDQSGEMKINLASVENLNSSFNIYLIDHEKSKGQNLRNNPEYTFSIKEGMHNSRFELMFSEEEVTSPAIAFNEPFDVAVEDGSVVVSLNLEENEVGIIRASTVNGQIIQTKEAGGKDRVIFDGITSNGVYIINLQVGKAQHAKKVLIKK